MPTVECVISRSALIEDLQILQQHQGVTQEVYALLGSYTEDEWHEHFPTFESFLAAAAPAQPRFDPLIPDFIDLSLSIPGDILIIDGKRYKLLKKGRTAVSIKRQYWFDDWIDWFTEKVETWDDGL